MAIIRKTVSGLKPDSNYLFAVKPKNTEISASDEIPDSIRIKTPSSGSVPSTITSFNIYCNFESVMFVFQPVVDQDFAEYEYEIYDGDSATPNLVSTGKKRSTVFVISVPNTTSNVNPTTGVETVVYKKYYGRVRAINTSGNAGAWTSLVTHSGNIPLIEDQYIGSLTAGKITTGLMTAEQVILQNASGTLRSYTTTAGMSVIRSSNFKTGPLGTGEGWIIRGDGYAEFDATNIRGSLTASSIALDAYNYWKPEVSPGTGYQFEAGNGSDKVLKWSTTTGILTIKGTMSGGSVGGATVNSDKIFLGTGTYANSNTPFFVGMDSGVNKFSLGDKFTWNGSTLSINGGGTFTGALVGGTIQIGSGESVFKADTNGIYLGNETFANAEFRVTPAGGLTATSAAITGTVSGSTITGSTFASTNNLFRVDDSGNAFANNIYATGSSSDFGLQIRADGNPSTGSPNYSTSGAIWILSATNKETKLGNTLGSINVRYRAASGSIPEAVVLEPAYFTGSIWSQNRNFEINVASGYKFLVNSDIILRGSALDGFANDFATGDMNIDGGGQDGRVVQLDVGLGVTSWVVSRSGSSIKYKENITPVDTNAALNLIKKLELKKFTYKRNNKYDTDISYELKQLNYEYGFIAEEVAVSAKELAVYSFTKSGIEKKWQNFEYEDLNNEEYVQPDNWKRQSVIALLVGAVQNLNERIEFLESQLAAQ